MSSEFRVPTGTALKIYVTLLSSNRPLGVREIQRRLGLKSPSTVKYHLDRLKVNGLVKQLPDGRYVAVKGENPLTTTYIFLRSSPIPRLVPITIFFTIFNIVYVILSNSVDIILLASLTIFSIYIIYEGFKLRSLLKVLMGGD